MCDGVHGIEYFTDTARRLTILTLIGLQLDELWPQITEIGRKMTTDKR